MSLFTIRGVLHKNVSYLPLKGGNTTYFERHEYRNIDTEFSPKIVKRNKLHINFSIKVLYI